MKRFLIFILGMLGLLVAPLLFSLTCPLALTSGGDCSSFAIIFYGIPAILILYPTVMKIIEVLEK